MINIIIGVVIGGAILKGLEAWWRNRGPRVKMRPPLGQPAQLSAARLILLVTFVGFFAWVIGAALYAHGN